jgi:hypothetical protein
MQLDWFEIVVISFEICVVILIGYAIYQLVK